MALLGSAGVKAARKTMVKLTRGEGAFSAQNKALEKKEKEVSALVDESFVPNSLNVCWTELTPKIEYWYLHFKVSEKRRKRKKGILKSVRKKQKRERECLLEFFSL